VAGGYAGGIAPAGGPINTGIVTGNPGSISYMVFNLGAGKLERGFHNFTKAIHSGNYTEAAAQSNILHEKLRSVYNKNELLKAAQGK